MFYDVVVVNPFPIKLLMLNPVPSLSHQAFEAFCWLFQQVAIIPSFDIINQKAPSETSNSINLTNQSSQRQESQWPHPAHCSTSTQHTYLAYCRLNGIWANWYSLRFVACSYTEVSRFYYSFILFFFIRLARC